MDAVKDIVIIGAGPAGVSATIQLKRLGLNPYLIDKSGVAGGLIQNAYSIENYVGIEKPVSGSTFVELIKKKLEHFDIHVHKFEARRVTIKNDHKVIIDNEGKILLAKEIIVAVGTVPKRLSLTNVSEGNVFYDLVSLKETINLKSLTDISVVGGGEAALDYALSLSREGLKPTIYVRSDKLKAAKRLIELVDKEKIIIKYNSALNKEGPCVVAIGRITAMGLIDVCEGVIDKDLIIGDAKRNALGQLGIAVGDGLLAAKKVYMRIKYNENIVL